MPNRPAGSTSFLLDFSAREAAVPVQVQYSRSVPHAAVFEQASVSYFTRGRGVARVQACGAPGCAINALWRRRARSRSRHRRRAPGCRPRCQTTGSQLKKQ